MGDLASIIDKFGLPLGMLIVLIFALWRAAVWAKLKVAEPIIDAHLLFMKAATKAQIDQSLRMDEIAMNITKQTEMKEEILLVTKKQALCNEEIKIALKDQTVVLRQSIEKQTKDLK